VLVVAGVRLVDMAVALLVATPSARAAMLRPLGIGAVILLIVVGALVMWAVSSDHFAIAPASIAAVDGTRLGASVTSVPANEQGPPVAFVQVGSWR